MNRLSTPFTKVPSLFRLVLLGMWGMALLPHAHGQDCRIQPEDFRPLIVRFNPFFAHHAWDADALMEIAEVDEHRLLMITQEGCKRHHVKFSLIIDAETAHPQPQFWKGELKQLMQMVYWDRKDYSQFGEELEKAFAEKLPYYGINNSFNFPVGSRNFLCAVYYEPGRGGRLSIEMISYIFRERIEQPTQRIDPQKDDGWSGSGPR